MQSRLQSWGSDAQEHACNEWLQLYRLGEGGKDGTVYTFLRHSETQYQLEVDLAML